MLNVKALLTKILSEIETLTGRFNGRYNLTSFNISNGSSANITTQSGTRGFLFCCASGTSQNAIYGVGTANAGTTTANKFASGAGTGVTVTAGSVNNRITVNNNAGVMVTVFYLSTY